MRWLVSAPRMNINDGWGNSLNGGMEHPLLGYMTENEIEEEIDNIVGDQWQVAALSVPALCCTHASSDVRHCHFTMSACH